MRGNLTGNIQNRSSLRASTSAVCSGVPKPIHIYQVEALAEIKNPAHGDLAIITRLISTDHEEITAYIYDGRLEVWVAIDENYSAENIYFAEDLVFTYDFGKYKANGKEVIVPAANKNIKQLLQDAFSGEHEPEETLNLKNGRGENSLQQKGCFAEGINSIAFGEANTNVRQSEYIIQVENNAATNKHWFTTKLNHSVNQIIKIESKIYKIVEVKQNINGTDINKIYLDQEIEFKPGNHRVTILMGVAYGKNAISSGFQTKALGNNSHAEGEGTIASGENQHVSGKFNIADESSLVIIGDGERDSNRSNALKINNDKTISLYNEDKQEVKIGVNTNKKLTVDGQEIGTGGGSGSGVEMNVTEPITTQLENLKVDGVVYGNDALTFEVSDEDDPTAIPAKYLKINNDKYKFGGDGGGGTGEPEIVSVDNLPSPKTVNGTAIPTQGPAGKIYFGTKVTESAVNAILDKLPYTTLDVDTQAYVVANTDLQVQPYNRSQAIIIFKVALDETHIVYLMANSNKNMPIIYYVSGPKEVIQQDLNLESGWQWDYINFSGNYTTVDPLNKGMSVGTANDLLASIISTTEFNYDFSDIKDKIIYQKEPEKQLNYYNSNKQEWAYLNSITRISAQDFVKLPLAKKGSYGEIIPTTIPHDYSYVSQIYFNTTLTENEVNNYLNNCVGDTPYNNLYYILATKNINHSFVHLIQVEKSNLKYKIIDRIWPSLNSTYSINTIYVSGYSAEELAALNLKSNGWQITDPVYLVNGIAADRYDLNTCDSKPVGNKNDKIKELCSSTSFIDNTNYSDKIYQIFSGNFVNYAKINNSGDNWDIFLTERSDLPYGSKEIGRNVTIEKTGIHGQNIENSIALGYGTIVSGSQSIAAGSNTKVTRDDSIAEGSGTIAAGYNQHAMGSYNIADESSLLIIGNGNNESTRSNVMKVDDQGIIIYSPNKTAFRIKVDDNGNLSTERVE